MSCNKRQLIIIVVYCIDDATMIISNLLKRYVSWIYMFQLALQSQDQLISMSNIYHEEQ